jgi:CBS domain-containing protein
LPMSFTDLRTLHRHEARLAMDWLVCSAEGADLGAACYVLSHRDISGVAVQDKSGNLLGSYTFADLRCINPEHFGKSCLLMSASSN